MGVKITPFGIVPSKKPIVNLAKLGRKLTEGSKHTGGTNKGPEPELRSKTNQTIKTIDPTKIKPLKFGQP